VLDGLVQVDLAAVDRDAARLLDGVRDVLGGDRAEEATVLTIAQPAGEDGRLFGSVTNQDLADAIKEARGIDVDRRKIHLDDPIKNVGTYQVVLEVGEGVTATVKVMVTEA